MKIIKTFLLVIVIIAILLVVLNLTGILQFGKARFEDSHLYSLTSASPITLLNNYTTTDTSTHLYFINFWAIWCGNCIKEMNNLNTIRRYYKDDKSIRFLSFTDDDSVSCDRLLSDRHINFEFEKFYSVKGLRSQLKKICLMQHVKVDTIDALPCFFVIDKNGHIVKYIEGSINGNEMAIKSNLDSLKATY